MLDEFLAGARFLIVDDERVNVSLLEQLLEFNGYSNLRGITDSRHAVDIFQEYQPDIVLLDLMMPEVNGFEVMARLKPFIPEDSFVPILILTADSSPTTKHRALTSGGSDFLTKPFDVNEVAIRIKNLLRTRWQHLQLHHQNRLLEERNRLLEESGELLQQQSREINEKNKAMEGDLLMARELQLAFLPETPSLFPHDAPAERTQLRVATEYIPSSELAGDFFDILFISPHQMGVFICDVMGHGVRSALVTAVLRGLVEEFRALADQPGAFLTEINRRLVDVLKQSRTLMFATAFYCVFDIDSSEFQYANAGHSNALLAHRNSGLLTPLGNGSVEAGPALGLFPDSSYQTECTTWCKDDLFLVYTDGLCEVEAEDGSEFDEEKLWSAVGDNLKVSPPQLLNTLLGLARSYAPGGRFEDDICVVAVELGTAALESQ